MKKKGKKTEISEDKGGASSNGGCGSYKAVCNEVNTRKSCMMQNKEDRILTQKENKMKIAGYIFVYVFE